MATTIHPISQTIRSIYNRALEKLTSTESTVIYAHFGEFTARKVDDALRTVEDSLAERKLKRTSVKRFCNVFIEAMQNIVRHSAHDREGLSYGFAIVAGMRDAELLVCGNLVFADEMAALGRRITRLNERSGSEIRKLFIETLCNDDFNSKAGAGLGLIMIAKKLERKIDFELTRFNDKLGYFKLELLVPH